MDENCKDCIQARLVGEQLDRLSEKVAKCEDGFDCRIHTLEKQVAVSDEKFKQIFEKLDKIIAILDKNSERLPNVVWGIIGAVGAGAVLFFIKGF